MLTDDQRAALLMVIADLRIQLANTAAERDMFKKMLADQQAAKAEATDG